MSAQTATVSIPDAPHLKVERSAPLSRCTTWRIGGPAEFLVRTANAEDIAAAARWATSEGMPLSIIGGGSNLLIDDAGLRGLVIVSKVPGERSEALVTLEDEGESVLMTIGAQAPLSWAGRYASERGLAGMDWGVGLPGAIGGATVNNAGAHGAEQKDHLVSAHVLTLDGNVRMVDREWLNPTYRNTRIKSMSRPRGHFVLDVTMRLRRGDTVELVRLADEHTAYRKATQPTGACGGSTFANPPGDFSGRLLEVAGLKGYAIGPVSFSTKHTNFIVNGGGGTSTQVLDLIEHGRSVVHEQFGVRLETEIEYLSDKMEAR